MSQRNNIPSDLHEEILYLLPSSDLLNFKRVCKDWKQLISCQRFIQKHLHRSNGTLIFEVSGSGIMVCDDPTGKKIYRNISFPREFSVKEIYGNISYAPEFSVNDTRIAGSCDGLVCLVLLNSKVFAIINPSTGTYDVRKTEGFVFHSRQVFWFGKHPSTGEYLIIALEVTSSGIAQVYQFSSKPGFSQYFSIPPTANYYPPTAYCSITKPILLHGALHWLVIHHDLRLVVFAYDIQKNKLLEIFPPFGQPFRVVRLGTVEGCLIAIIWRERKFELWIMKEYGVAESWTKYCKIEGIFEEYIFLSPLGFLADGVLLLNCGNKMIVKYSFSDKKGTVVHRVNSNDFFEHDIAVLCGDSLVSPSFDLGK